MNLADVRALRTRLSGDFVLPDDEGWDAARQAWNLAVDQRPAAVALPESAADVIHIVDFARRNGLRVAPQGTGHNANPLALEQTVLVKTERMRNVEIDPEHRQARVDAGVIWIEVVEAAAEHGLAALAGSSPDVGVVGYSLGGGLSWLGRKYGLGANSVTAIELVTADGNLVRADASTEPDLFWALRGGGGSFGIVTALEFTLYPIAEVYAGVLFWPAERATEILNAWREWITDVPVEMTSVGRLLNLPKIPDVPEPLRGRSFVVVETIYVGDEEQGAEFVAPLRALGPEIDTVATIPAKALSRLHMDPEQPVPGIGEGMLLAEFPAEAVDAIVARVGPDSPLLSVEVRHLGGALADRAPHHGALAAVDGNFAMFAVGLAMTSEMWDAVVTHVDDVRHALAPWDSGRVYLNFTERPGDPNAIFGAETYERLRKVKRAYDPNDLFRANHPVAPARRPTRPRAAATTRAVPPRGRRHVQVREVGT